MSYETVSHEDLGVEKKSGSSTGWIILAVIVVIFLIVIIGWFLLREEGTSVSSVAHTWNIITNTNTGTQTFDATGGNLYLNTAKSSIILNLVPPSNPEGQEFIIDNSSGGGAIIIATGITVVNTITYNGAGVNPPAGSILIGKTSAYVWQNATTILRLY
jgi:hypothetical protein